MKKIIEAVIMTAVLLISSVASQDVEAKAPEKYLQETTTEIFMVQSATSDGYLDCAPVNPEVEGGYILDNDGKYKIGDIVEITYLNDDIIESHKLDGKELSGIEKKYGSNIDQLMDKAIEILEMRIHHEKRKTITEASVDVQEKIAVENGNEYTVGVELQPQKLVKGEWVDLEWYDFDFYESGEKKYSPIEKEFNGESGTYRYKVRTVNFDYYGYEFNEEVSYTESILIK